MVVSEYMSTINSIKKKLQKFWNAGKWSKISWEHYQKIQEIVDNWTTQPKIPEFTETESSGK